MLVIPGRAYDARTRNLEKTDSDSISSLRIGPRRGPSGMTDERRSPRDIIARASSTSTKCGKILPRLVDPPAGLNGSTFVPLVHAATKSFTNFPFESAHA